MIPLIPFPCFQTAGAGPHPKLAATCSNHLLSGGLQCGEGGHLVPRPPGEHVVGREILWWGPNDGSAAAIPCDHQDQDHESLSSILNVLLKSPLFTREIWQGGQADVFMVKVLVNVCPPELNIIFLSKYCSIVPLFPKKAATWKPGSLQDVKVCLSQQRDPPEATSCC